MLKTSLKWKVLSLMALPLVALLALVAYGIVTMSGTRHVLDSVVNDQFLPLIEGEVKKLLATQDSMALILNADRDAYQATLAEHQALLTDSKQELADDEKAILENMGQTAERMQKASAIFNDKEQALYKQFQQYYRQWTENTREVHRLAAADDRERALALSKGAAKENFDKMRDLIDQITISLEENVAAEMTAMQQRRELVEKQAKEQSGSAASAITIFLVVSLLATVALFVFALWFANRFLIRPINQVVDELYEIAQGGGDLTTRLDILSEDEIGKLGDNFNVFVQKLQKSIGEVAADTHQLNASSDTLSDLAQKMAGSAEEMTSQANVVAASTEEVSVNLKEVTKISETMARGVTTIAAASEEMSTNVGTVAAAIEEMTASLSEVAKSCVKAADFVNSSQAKVNATTEIMNILDKAAGEIGKVVEMIGDIADQTNLLALNATIEAASAGEAGKGFAVVAGEVKELANQTASATNGIAEKITLVQEQVGKSVKSIQEVTESIAKVNQIMDAIVAAVEQQTNTTNEISRSVVGAAQGANDVSRTVQEIDRNLQQVVLRSIQEAANGVNEASRGIQEVSRSAGTTSQIAANTNSVAQQVAGLAEQLQQVVQQFKVV